MTHTAGMSRPNHSVDRDRRFVQKAAMFAGFRPGEESIISL